MSKLLIHAGILVLVAMGAAHAQSTPIGVSPSAATVDFDSFWKTVSVLLTGLFGGIGLLTTFRDETTKRVTRWGMISLAGIAISTFGGVWAAIDSEIKAGIQERKQAEQANNLLGSVGQTLSNVERLLTPLGSKTHIRVEFDGKCPNLSMRAVCTQLSSLFPDQGYPGDSPVNLVNVDGRLDPVRQQVGIELTGVFYMNPKAAFARVMGHVPEELTGDTTSFSTNTFGDPGARGVMNTFRYFPHSHRVTITITFDDVLAREGELSSWKDIEKSTLVMIPRVLYNSLDIYRDFVFSAELEDNIANVHILPTSCKGYTPGSDGMVFLVCSHFLVKSSAHPF